MSTFDLDGHTKSTSLNRMTPCSHVYVHWSGLGINSPKWRLLCSSTSWHIKKRIEATSALLKQCYPYDTSTVVLSNWFYSNIKTTPAVIPSRFSKYVDQHRGGGHFGSTPYRSVLLHRRYAFSW